MYGVESERADRDRPFRPSLRWCSVTSAIGARLLGVGFLPIVRVLRIALLAGPGLVGVLTVGVRSLSLNTGRRTSVLDDHFTLLIRRSTRLRCLKRSFAALGLSDLPGSVFPPASPGSELRRRDCDVPLGPGEPHCRSAGGAVTSGSRSVCEFERARPSELGFVASTVPRALVCLAGVRLLLRLRLRRVVAAALFRRIDVRLLAPFLPRRVDCRACGTAFVLRICLSSAIGPGSAVVVPVSHAWLS